MRRGALGVQRRRRNKLRGENSNFRIIKKRHFLTEFGAEFLKKSRLDIAGTPRIQEHKPAPVGQQADAAQTALPMPHVPEAKRSSKFRPMRK